MSHSSLTRLSALALVLSLLALLASCTRGAPAALAPESGLSVLAVETFLADISQNVAGDRLRVDALIPVGVDPHGFQPTPANVRKVADSQVLIVNGAGFEVFLDEMLRNAGGQRTVITAAAGLQGREPKAGEQGYGGTGQSHPEGDPHFWLDPVSVITYTENIRDGLSRADPAGAQTYAANADAYIARLQDLDRWITEQVQQIPGGDRKLVTNHESFGYFADRYGFTVIGTIIPSVSAGASPSARELASLADHARAAGVKAIFLETGSNPQLARQLAQEVGIKAVTELYTHSITDAAGPAPTYIEMMKFNVVAIVDALQ